MNLIEIVLQGVVRKREGWIDFESCERGVKSESFFSDICILALIVINLYHKIPYCNIPPQAGWVLAGDVHSVSKSYAVPIQSRRCINFKY